jgi:hypothetical protein
MRGKSFWGCRNRAAWRKSVVRPPIINARQAPTGSLLSTRTLLRLNANYIGHANAVSTMEFDSNIRSHS